MTRRIEKFQELISHKLSAIIYTYQLQNTTITVTSVQVSRDFKYATVYLSIFGNSRKNIFDQINKNRNQISKQLAASLDTKYSPKLKFKIDTSLDDSERISRLLSC